MLCGNVGQCLTCPVVSFSGEHAYDVSFQHEKLQTLSKIDCLCFGVRWPIDGSSDGTWRLEYNTAMLTNFYVLRRSFLVQDHSHMPIYTAD